MYLLEVRSETVYQEGGTSSIDIGSIMKKEEEVQQDNTKTGISHSTMTSAVRHTTHTEENPYNGGYAHGVAYYPTPTVHGTDSSNVHHHSVGHPPMAMAPYPSSALQSNLPPPMRPYYPQPGIGYRYLPEPGFGYAAPAPPPPPPHYHPAQPQAAYHGSWPGAAAAPPIDRRAHYPFYPMLPQDAHAHRPRRKDSFPNDGNQRCGSLPFEVEGSNQGLAWALDYVNRNPRATLFDVEGIIPDLARVDAGACRFIQKRLRFGSAEEKRLGLDAALASLEDLLCDHFGNFMLQGLFEFGTAEIRKELMDAIYGQDVVALCLHMHGCRVIQKAILHLGQEDVSRLITEFHDKVLSFIHDPNGNHVIQKCITAMSAFARGAAADGDPDLASALADRMGFVVDDVVRHVAALSTHRYGCRVVQRAIEHCVDAQRDRVLEGAAPRLRTLATDQYGNYVAQQVVTRGGEAHRDAAVRALTEGGALRDLSRHKYASNVVEAVLVHGRPHHRERILGEMLKDARGEDGGSCCVIELTKDPIANYVVNKAIEVSESEQKEKFFEIISASREELSKSPYAKYVLQRIDKMPQPPADDTQSDT